MSKLTENFKKYNSILLTLLPNSMILRTFYPIAHIHLVTTQQTWASSLKRQMVSFLNLCLVLPFFPQIEYQLVTISSQKTTKTFWAKLQIAWEMALIKANTCSIPVVFILSFNILRKRIPYSKCPKQHIFLHLKIGFKCLWKYLEGSNIYNFLAWQQFVNF